MTWNLTTYLLDAYHFPFLASLERPFTKFCLNNSIIPFLFLVLYLIYSIYFQSYYEFYSIGQIITNCTGFIIGLLIMVLVAGGYFSFTNADIRSLLNTPKNRVSRFFRLAPGRRNTQLKRLAGGISRWRVDTFISEKLKLRLVRQVSHYDMDLLLRVFRQNHLNALLVQLVGLITLIVLGMLIDNPYFRIPAGASIFILITVFIALTGAITYWFDQWRLPVFVSILVCINWLTSYDLFHHKNEAYGLNYDGEYAAYDIDETQKHIDTALIEKDKLHTQKILDRWLMKRVQQGENKPKMVLLGVSGGGMKAAVWSMQVLQKADADLGGRVLDHCTLITGASGGLIGTAYLREILLRRNQGNDIDLYSKEFIENISKDLLNSVSFTIVANDLFMPWMEFERNKYAYRKDRGYIFESQLNENTKDFLNKDIRDYQIHEEQAQIPMLFITPSIVNDGRRMIISPHGVSYMQMAPIGTKNIGAVEADAVDFGRLFENQDGYHLSFTTALRMNATYPYILPNVHLPSVPELEVMDAGFRDNYGIMSATRFMHVFKDWISENTSGVILLLISSQEKFKTINNSDRAGVIETFFNPLGIVSQIMSLQDYEHDNSLGLVHDLLGEDNFEVIRFIYQPTTDRGKASMTFHLTNREKSDVLSAYYLEDNQKSLRRLKEVLGEY